MNQPTTRLRQLLIPEHGIMTGFCYAFSKALLAKLNALVTERRFFQETAVAEKDPDNPAYHLTDIGNAVLNHLKQ